MFHNKSFRRFEKEQPEKAAVLRKYIADGGEWSTIMFLAEYQDYMRHEDEFMNAYTEDVV